MRSIARWVLPVLVGPSTAVTPAPRARASRFTGEENEMAILCPENRKASRPFQPLLYHNATVERLPLRCGTSPERIAAESLTRKLSDFVHCHISRHPSRVPP